MTMNKIAGIKQNVLDDQLWSSVFCYFSGLLTKQLIPENHIPYSENRISSYISRFGLTSAQADLLRAFIPPLQSCQMVYRRIGNRVAFRRAVLQLAQRFACEANGTVLQLISSMLLPLYSFTEIAHIVMIQRYVVNRSPAILNLDEVRAEAAIMGKALARLVEEEEAPYIRMRQDPSEIPELTRKQIPLLAAYAQQRAQRDIPTMANYASKLEPGFREAVENLTRAADALASYVPGAGMDLLRHEYDADTVVHVQATMQANVSEVRSFMGSLFSGPSAQT